MVRLEVVDVVTLSEHFRAVSVQKARDSKIDVVFDVPVVGLGSLFLYLVGSPARHVKRWAPGRLGIDLVDLVDGERVLVFKEMEWRIGQAWTVADQEGTLTLILVR